MLVTWSTRGVRRTFATRAGQPTTLSVYIRGGAPMAPRAVRDAEAEAMGRMDADARTLARPAPSINSDSFARARAAFNRDLGVIRVNFKDEWAARRERESAAAAAAQVTERAAVALARATRRVASTAAIAASKEAVIARAATRRVAREVRARTAARRAGALSTARGTWVDALTVDARDWVLPNDIDTRITPALFAEKQLWQWREWFAGKELKRRVREDARRARVPGKPLAEPILPEAAAAYASDWESDDEASAEGNSPAGREADEEAKADGTGKVREALLLARRSARARAARFFEPAYDADGEPLLVPGSPGAEAAAKAAAAGGKDGEGSVSLAELAQGKPLAEILRDYELWLEAEVKALVSFF